jgi:hypothetical protein
MSRLEELRQQALQWSDETRKIQKGYEGFKKLGNELSQRKGKKKVKNVKALEAWIGRRKYGKAKFQAAAAHGKKMG